MCPLCSPQNENLIYHNELFRVILVEDNNYPGFVRLTLNKHVKEMSDLSSNQASYVFAALMIIEKQIRQVFNPDKINLASLGNFVPHLHWHIIPRYKNDRHFPNPIWGEETNIEYIPDQTLVALQDKLLISLSEQLNCSLIQGKCYA